ncbi:ethylene-responsive transcription factor ERF020 [Olea europaea var. sylvestris]|uniref:ethylene-responsive transcription factor ERF020 n=1 Tax=Olea europaea var. sylvestris TaxID=158386 RepID=UPI000C1D27E7|nr:ethylene-responsive transcription factor ERF020 [Olea europaea var. sylvestris]
MSMSNSDKSEKKYKGIRRRKWGKWVSEIRVPGTQDRLWLGSYSTPEAAAVAHDTALYCLRGASSSLDNFNFPLMLPASSRIGMSPRSVQRVSSDAGMAIDAQFLASSSSDNVEKVDQNGKGSWLDDQ